MSETLNNGKVEYAVCQIQFNVQGGILKSAFPNYGYYKQ